ncbi:MAG TPA: patatin-like phospholipase family protein [Woeseiaceae bacterium]|nr:patatin-like phospholipase family protein [Woeseiaceae bacterium]
MLNRMTRASTGLAFLVTVFLFAPGAMAQLPADEDANADNDGRPRIGLVLGGGGARGAAHIGVLRELERLRVPVHAIAGTSMGAIIGGLYASGMTPQELENLISNLDWAEVFQDAPQRESLSYRRKQDDVDFPVEFELGLNRGRLQLPKGLIQGQKLSPLLRELTLDVAHISDFDELPTPFRALASDIETGESIVLSEGDLTLAMRASMSAPGFFAPVIVDGRMLVDGGLVGNLPIETIREMNVDIIIAVDVEFPLYSREELDSAVGITGQVLTILIHKETERQLATLDEDDILIRPQLGDFGSTNFAGITKAVQPGAEATLAQATRLRSLAIDEESYQRYQAERRPSGEQNFPVAFVRVDDNGPLSARVLQSRLSTRAGETISPQTLADDVARLYGLDLYEHVGYRLVREGEEIGVVFETVPKSWGPNLLQFGLSLEDDFEGSTAFNVSGRITRAGINLLGAEWRTDLQLGTEPYLATEFYQPLSFDSKFFVAPRLRLEQTNLNGFDDDLTVARYRIGEGEIALDLGRQLGRWGEFRVGAFRGTGNARVIVGEPDIPNIDFQTGGISASFGVDTLDDGQIPKSGMLIDSTLTMSRPAFGADNNFDTIETTLTKVFTRGRHTFQMGVDFSTTIQSDNLIQDFFPLGGFLRLSGLERGQITGPHAGLTRAVWFRRSGETGGGLFDVPLYLGASLEAGNVWQTRSDISLDSLIVNGSIFAGLDTYFGPLFLAAGIAEGGQSSFYLFLGTPPR